MKCSLLYLKTHFVPHIKHLPSWLQTPIIGQNLLFLLDTYKTIFESSNSQMKLRAKNLNRLTDFAFPLLIFDSEVSK